MSRASLVELTNLCVICDGSRVLVSRALTKSARQAFMEFLLQRERMK